MNQSEENDSSSAQNAKGWADGVCPSCGGEEWDIERHWGRPALSVYTCPCGAWDHTESAKRLLLLDQ